VNVFHYFGIGRNIYKCICLCFGSWTCVGILISWMNMSPYLSFVIFENIISSQKCLCFLSGIKYACISVSRYIYCGWNSYVRFEAFRANKYTKIILGNEWRYGCAKNRHFGDKFLKYWFLSEVQCLWSPKKILVNKFI
jgi:hypothetical protein